MGLVGSGMSQPLSVLLLTDEYPPSTLGGLGTYVWELAHALVDVGHRVNVMVMDLSGASRVERSPSLVVHRVGPSARTRAIGPVPDGRPTPEHIRSYMEDIREHVEREVLAHGRPDVVNCNDAVLANVALALARPIGAVAVMTVHLLLDPIFTEICGQTVRPSKLAQEADALRAVDGIIAVSRPLGDVLVERRGIKTSRVHVAQSGLAYAPFTAAARDEEAAAALRREHAPANEKIILFVGRITRQKGVLELLRAARIVAVEEPDARWLLVGRTLDLFEDPQDFAGLLRGLLDDPRLRGRVTLAGEVSRDRLAAMYSIASMAVVPSFYECFGYAAVEAMACGVPVVASRSGGLSEIVAHEDSGLLVPMKQHADGACAADEDALAEAQLRLLRDPALAARLGAAGQVRVASTFSSEHMAARTVEAYRRVRAARA